MYLRVHGMDVTNYQMLGFRLDKHVWPHCIVTTKYYNIMNHDLFQVPMLLQVLD